MLFVFIGLSHTKYAMYLLEFLTTFKLESNKVLRDWALNSLLVNLSGIASHFAPGDII